MQSRATVKTPGAWSEFDKYLRPETLHGRRVTVTISSVTIEETHPRPGIKEQAPVLHFENRSRGLVLSPTNRHTLARLFGDEIECCIGKRVDLQTVEVKVGNEMKTPIRVFAPRVILEVAAPTEASEAGADQNSQEPAA